jgi:PAS domain S-box-containing protein
MKLILNAAGEPVEILGSWVDVTDRKKTEEALRKSEEKYRTLFESATDAIFILDLEGNFIDINSAAYTRLGFTKEEMLSLHISRLDPPEFAARVPERLAQISRFGETVFESAHLRKDGSIMPVEVNSRLLEYGGQQVYFSIIRDITERKRAEERIKQNLKEKELLLREIHHRVKNNMAVISGLLDLQSARIQEDAMKELFNESRQRIKSMALVHDKLYNTEDLSRIDFSDYINSIVKDLISSYNKEGREIITKISAGDILLEIESAIPCGLIINELVTNAMKHAFPGKTGGEITVSFTKSCNIYTLFIHDNGIGLPEGFDYTRTNTLGLQLVDALTRQLKGNLKFQSGTAANQGTSVIMTFSEKKGETES